MEAYKHVRRSYHNKLEFTKNNHLNLKIKEFKGNGKKLFGVMYDKPGMLELLSRI